MKTRRRSLGSRASAGNVSIRVIVEAAGILGGTRALAAYLEVTPDEVDSWIAGARRPSRDQVAKAGDLLLT